MAVNITPRVWNSNPQNSSNLLLVTKLTDLGVPDKKKNVSGCYFNLGMSGRQADFALENNYNFVICYRKSTAENWIPITFLDSNQAGITSGTVHHRIPFLSPIKAILHLQLKIKANYVRGSMFINDFGFIYRTLGTSNVQTHDED